MEFDLDINMFFKDPISKLDSRLQVCRNGNTNLRFPEARKLLFQIIDKMGMASAQAQHLPAVITTGRKLEISDHHLYVMKDPEESSELGSVIGILKIGRKRLFVYDCNGKQWEMNPICILDFYIHESRQRRGFGRRLFDFMLKEENIVPQHLAIDYPSLKFGSFLAKHYGLTDEIPQVNNFVIFNGFFTHRPSTDYIQNRRNINEGKPADYGSKDERPNSRGKAKLYPYQRSNTTNINRGANMVPFGQNSHSSMQQNEAIKDLNINPRSASSAFNLSVSPGKGSETESGLSEHGRTTSLQLQNNMYSRHPGLAGLAHTQQIAPSPSPGNGRYSPSGNLNARHPAAAHSSSTVNVDSNQPPSGNFNAQRPPSVNAEIADVGNRNAGTSIGEDRSGPPKENSPPLLPDDRPPKDYNKTMNLHQNYQSRTGHLMVPSDPRLGQPQTGPGALNGKPASSNTPPGYNIGSGYYTRSALQANGPPSWTLDGLIRNHNYLQSRNYQRTRLW